MRSYAYTYNTNKKNYIELSQTGGKRKNINVQLLAKSNRRSTKISKSSRAVVLNQMDDNIGRYLHRQTIIKAEDVVYDVGNIDDRIAIYNYVYKTYIEKKPLDFFIDKIVYVRIATGKTGKDDIKSEWIWIYIDSVDKENNILNGFVDVEPQFLDNLKYKDKIKIKKEDIAMIQIIDLVNFYMKLTENLKKENIYKYYDQVFEYIIKSNLDGTFYNIKN